MKIHTAIKNFAARAWWLGATALLALAVMAVFLWSPYSLPAAANLAAVKKNLTPTLTTALAEKNLNLGNEIFIRIFKEEKTLELWMRRGDTYVLFKEYPICYYSGRLGPKIRQGDEQSPEGFYSVAKSQLNPNSQFHLSFNLGYPNAYDRAHNRTGDYLMVHGNCVSIGCYAMTDAGIEEIYLIAEAALNHGQPRFHVHIFPFRMNTENMTRHKTSNWYAFWQNLQSGYDYFENNRQPPKVSVRNKQYVIAAR